MENTLAENRVSQTVLQMRWKNDRLRTPRNVTADVKKKLLASEIEIVFQMYNLSEGASHHISVVLCQFIPVKATSKVEICAVLESSSHIGIFP